MKPNELMIGDWVEYGQYISTVRNLSDKIVLSGCIGRLDEVRPVPITPEILKANGFKSRGRYGFVIYQFGKECFSIAYDTLLKTLDAFVKQAIDVLHGNAATSHANLSINIQYVHELQHAMHLMGLHDMANNFKVKGGHQ